MLVVSGRYLWLSALSALAVAALVVVFHWPGMSLPNSEHFQLFFAQHPFEK